MATLEELEAARRAALGEHPDAVLPLPTPEQEALRRVRERALNEGVEPIVPEPTAGQVIQDPVAAPAPQPAAAPEAAAGQVVPQADLVQQAPAEATPEQVLEKNQALGDPDPAAVGTVVEEPVETTTGRSVNEERALDAVAEQVSAPFRSLFAAISPALEPLGDLFGVEFRTATSARLHRQKQAQAKEEVLRQDAAVEEKLQTGFRDIANEAVDAVNKSEEGFQTALNRENKRNVQIAAEMAQGVRDPSQVFSSLKSWQKVSLFLGSGMFRALQATQGRSGGANPVIQALNGVIDRELESDRIRMNNLLKERASVTKNVDSLMMQRKFALWQIENKKALQQAAYIAEAKRQLAAEPDARIREAISGFLAEADKEYGNSLQKIASLTGSLTSDFGRLMTARAKARGKSGTGTAKPKKSGAIVIEVGPGEFGSPSIVIGEGLNEQQVILDIDKNNSRANALMEEVAAAHSTSQILQGLLAIPDEVLNDMIAHGVKDPRWARISARMGELKLRKQALVKGVPSKEDQKLVDASIGGDVDALFKLARRDRFKSAWETALKGNTQDMTNKLVNQFGVQHPGIRFKDPSSPQLFRLNMADPDAKPAPREGVVVSEEGTRAGSGPSVKKERQSKDPRKFLEDTAKAASAELTESHAVEARKAFEDIRRAFPTDLRAHVVVRQKAREQLSKIEDSVNRAGRQADREKLIELRRKKEALKELPDHQFTRDMRRKIESEIAEIEGR